MTDIERIAPNTLRFERELDAPVETVWRYLVESELRKQWFAAGELEPREGGSVELIFDHDNLSADDVPYPEDHAQWKCAVGHERVVKIDPPRLLAFTWDGGKEGCLLYTSCMSSRRRSRASASTPRSSIFARWCRSTSRRSKRRSRRPVAA